MSRWFRKKEKEKEKEKKGDPRPIKTVKSSELDPATQVSHRRQSSSSLEGKDENGRPVSSPSSNELAPTGSRPRSSSPLSNKISQESAIKETVSPTSSIVKQKTELFESLSKSNTPEHHRGSATLSPTRMSSYSASGRHSSSSGTTPTHDPFHSSKDRRMSALSSSGSHTTPLRWAGKQRSMEESEASMRNFLQSGLEYGREKEFEGVDLKLPPLQTSKVKHRDVIIVRSPALSGFGFNLRKSFQPDPEDPDNTLLVHLVEPRPTYVGPLMSGDRILEVNGENVESAPHERVVELIKLSGDSVNFKVASVPELVELNDRGVFDYSRGGSGRTNKKGVKPGAGTLRKLAAKKRSTMNFEVTALQCTFTYLLCGEV